MYLRNRTTPLEIPLLLIAVLLLCAGLMGSMIPHKRKEFSIIEYVNLWALLVVTLACGAYRFKYGLGKYARLLLAVLAITVYTVVNPIFLSASNSKGFWWIDLCLLVIGWLSFAYMDRLEIRSSRVAVPRNKIEKVLALKGVRRNLAIATFLTVTAASVLTGAPVALSCIRGALLGFGSMLILPILLAVQVRSTAGPLIGILLLVLGVTIVHAESLRKYPWRQLDKSRQLLATGLIKTAESELRPARLANETLRSSAFELAVELELAKYHESKNQFEESTVHWERVADLRKIDRAEFLPLQRVLCERGDSLSAWRRLVFKGFSSLNNPEIEPGIKRLGEISPDVRAKLLAALLAWDQNAPEAERKKKLEEVQKASPHEPSSRMLLQRMGVAAPPGPMLLPPALLVAPKSQHWTVPGSLEDNGRIGSLVVLEPGKWEMTLNMQATPLNEEWPIIRVELNGKALGSTQVSKSEPHLIPFTFEVNKGDIYRVTVVFENQRDELEGGRMRRRGLILHGIQFSQSSR